MAELFALVNTNFFDDFCQIERRELCQSAWQTAELVMKLLGWRISMSDDKRLPFSQEFNLLGAVVNLKEATAGIVEIHNKQSRLDDLRILVEDICSKQTVSLSTMET